MTDYMSTVTVYSETLTTSELISLLGAEITADMGLDDESDSINDGAARYVYFRRSHGLWIDERIGPALERIIATRPDVTEIEWRREDLEAQYDEVISATVYTRSGVTEFRPTLLPNAYPAMIAAIRDQRRAGNEHGAWLSVEHLLAAIEKGSTL